MYVLCFVLILTSAGFALEENNLPYLMFRVLYPTGYVMSLAHQPGIEKVGFRASLNRPISDDLNAVISWNVMDRWSGRWSYMDRKSKLRFGDELFFALDVQQNGKIYRYKAKAIATYSHPSSEESSSQDSSEERQLILVYSDEWLERNNQPWAKNEVVNTNKPDRVKVVNVV